MTTRIGIFFLALLCIGLSVFPHSPHATTAKSPVRQPATMEVQDTFGRTLNERGITLVDWEGQIANPALQLTLRPPPDALYPLTAQLHAQHALLMFDQPAEYGATGSYKTLRFELAAPQTFYLAVFPDRNRASETYTLEVTWEQANGSLEAMTLPIRVIDQDQDRPLDYTVTITHDFDTTGFFDDSPAGKIRQEIIREAVDDWAYFIADMNLDPTPPSSQWIYIWDAYGYFESGEYHLNPVKYTGYFLAVSGKNTPVPPWTINEVRAGGAPSEEGWLISGGEPIADAEGNALLRRAGTIELDIKGNYNLLGWYLRTGDGEDWWFTANLWEEQHDFYSIAHHEFGHAFGFDRRYPRFAVAGESTFDQPALTAYLGYVPSVDGFWHFVATVDPLSRRGMFGNEYFNEPGYMPPRRWLITKGDLIAVEAVGYTLRETSAFVPLSVAPDKITGAVGEPFTVQINPSGGIPDYHFWDYPAGCSLFPPGVTLDSFTGEISGVPTQPGIYHLFLQADDQDFTTPPLAFKLILEIGEASGVDLPVYNNETCRS